MKIVNRRRSRLSDAAALSPQARRRCRAVVAEGLDGEAHRHVYGASLGVGADAYLAVGGFPADGAGEDHALWRRPRTGGYPLMAPTAIRAAWWTRRPAARPARHVRNRPQPAAGSGH